MQVMPPQIMAARTQMRQLPKRASVWRGIKGIKNSVPIAKRDQATNTGATPNCDVRIFPALSPAGISDMAINMINTARCMRAGLARVPAHENVI